MTLYKYIPPTRLSILTDGMIRFTQTAALNDPFELRPFFDALFPDNWVVDQLRGKEIDVTQMFVEAYEEQPASLREKVSLDQVLQMAKATLLEPGTQQFVPEVMKALMARIQDMTPTLRTSFWRELGTRVGILSLTEVPDSVTMWAHYADNHRGFVLQVDERHSFFNRRRSPNDEFFHLRRVAYSVPKPGRTLLDLDGTDFFLTKGTQWSDEHEWRMLVPLAGADRVLGYGDASICLFAFPPDCITGIIVGARATEALTRDLLQTARTTGFRHLQLERAELDDVTQTVRIVPIETGL